MEVGLHNNSCIDFFRFCDFCLMSIRLEQGESLSYAPCRASTKESHHCTSRVIFFDFLSTRPEGFAYRCHSTGRGRGEKGQLCYEGMHAFTRNFHPLLSAAQAAARGEGILQRSCCTSFANLALQFQSRGCAGQDNSLAPRQGENGVLNTDIHPANDDRHQVELARTVHQKPQS